MINEVKQVLMRVGRSGDASAPLDAKIIFKKNNYAVMGRFDTELEHAVVSRVRQTPFG